MKGLTPLIKCVREKNVKGVIKELELHPGDINTETPWGKTALFYAISSWNDEMFMHGYCPIRRAICRRLVEHGARFGNRVCKIPPFLVKYMEKIRLRRTSCSKTLTTLLGLKKFKRAPRIFEGANRDVMNLITRKMMREAGQMEEWDYEEREQKKLKLK